jgi:hypothetical protein
MFGSLLAIAKLEAVTFVYANLCPFVFDGCDQGMGNAPDFVSKFSPRWFCSAVRQSGFDLSTGYGLFSVRFEKGLCLMSDERKDSGTSNFQYDSYSEAVPQCLFFPYLVFISAFGLSSFFASILRAAPSGTARYPLKLTDLLFATLSAESLLQTLGMVLRGVLGDRSQVGSRFAHGLTKLLLPGRNSLSSFYLMQTF